MTHDFTGKSLWSQAPHPALPAAVDGQGRLDPIGWSPAAGSPYRLAAPHGLAIVHGQRAGASRDALGKRRPPRLRGGARAGDDLGR